MTILDAKNYYLLSLAAGLSSSASRLTGARLDFYAANQLGQMFADAGFKAVKYKKFMLATIAVHWAQKP